MLPWFCVAESGYLRPSRVRPAPLPKPDAREDRTVNALNPTPEQHRAKIKTVISERSPMAGLLGLGSLAAFASAYHSVGVASYTVVNERTVSIGAFGAVFVVQ